MSRVGLTLGKFAPLHRGHQYLIEAARAQVDKLYVLIYEADETWIPLKKRADWIRQLYPDVEVIEGHGAPQSYGYAANIIREQDIYIRSMMRERITHFFSSEEYGAHVAAGLSCRDVRVDMSRATHPVSATLVRANPARAREYLDPIVYHDFIKRVVILGAESTGKTTLTEILARRYRTTYAVEHGREFWIKYNQGGRLTANQMVELAREHRALEERAFAISSGLFFSDTNAITTTQFCRHYGHEVPATLQAMADEDMRHYDLYLVCDTDIPFAQDGTRQDEETRTIMQGRLLESLNRPYHVVSGDLTRRVRQVRALLES